MQLVDGAVRLYHTSGRMKHIWLVVIWNQYSLNSSNWNLPELSQLWSAPWISIIFVLLLLVNLWYHLEAQLNIPSDTSCFENFLVLCCHFCPGKSHVLHLVMAPAVLSLAQHFKRIDLRFLGEMDRVLSALKIFCQSSEFTQHCLAHGFAMWIEISKKLFTWLLGINHVTTELPLNWDWLELKHKLL